MKPGFTKGLFWAVLLLLCRAPLRGYDLPAPGGGATLSIETVPPNPDLYQLLPTIGVRLKTAAHPKGWVLVDELKTLCSTEIHWMDPSTLGIRLSESHLDHLHVYDGEVLGGVTLQIIIHEDEVLKRSVSSDGQWSLVVLKNCEDENWGLYLRKTGTPDYNQATGTGWADPSLFGGLAANFSLLELDWTGPRSVCAVVGPQPSGAEFKPKVGPISLEVVYDNNYHDPPAHVQVAKITSFKTKGFMNFLKFIK